MQRKKLPINLLMPSQMEVPNQLLAFLVLSGPAQGEKILLDRPVLLGRDPRSRIPFDDERVSRHHALVDMLDARAVVRDLGSKNGTFVNGGKIKDYHMLRPNDRVRLGKTMLAVVAVQPAELTIPRRATPSETGHETVGPANESAVEQLQINRRVLRQAADLTNRLALLSKGRDSALSIVSTISKEFEADGKGIFLLDPLLSPIYTNGEIPIGDAVFEKLKKLIAGGAIRHASLIGNRKELAKKQEAETYLSLPFFECDEVKSLLVLGRHPKRPFSQEHLELAETFCECARMLPLHEAVTLHLVQDQPDSLGMIIGSGEGMKRVRDQLKSYAATRATVLVQGESGTGKELCARAIWQLSERRFAPYLEVNSACMMPELIESELFGHEKGAFTGATERMIGKLEMADGGTIFLDEIGELPMDLQAKLLRVLEGQPFYRVGGRELVHSDVRFICATNRNLQQMMDEGAFRRDLFHRINILRLDIPPLRDRLEDVPELMQILMCQIQEEFADQQQFKLTPTAYRRLLSHPWPGNVRELRNVLQRMMLLSPSPLMDDSMIPPEIGMMGEGTTMKLPRLQVLTENMEREEIARALMEAHGQKSGAARLLGISRPTLDKKIKQYNLSLLAGRGKDLEVAEES